MHPALSVIIFTTASGAGYGLLAMLSIFYVLNMVPNTMMFGLVNLVIALALISGGLFSSLFHLGHPERAWRALSQWRSSWLSREGVLAILTYIPTFIFATGWIFLEQRNGFFLLAGLFTTLYCILTVFSTSMIYASLKTIPAWNNRWVPLAYMSLSAMSGLLLLNVLLSIYDSLNIIISYITSVLIVTALIIKLGYWRFIKSNKPDSTLETATGLGQFGKASLFQQPHTKENYIQKEMGFQVARKHADKLRLISLVFGFFLPLVFTLYALIYSSIFTIGLNILAFILAMVGIFIERWLFFAKARHTAMLYYGQDLKIQNEQYSG